MHWEHVVGATVVAWIHPPGPHLLQLHHPHIDGTFLLRSALDRGTKVGKTCVKELALSLLLFLQDAVGGIGGDIGKGRRYLIAHSLELQDRGTDGGCEAACSGKRSLMVGGGGICIMGF